jgi:thiol:disulfide interchange protein DsbA
MLAALLFVLPALSSLATAQAAEAGRDYLVMSPAQPTEARGKIEVVTFFWYRCPHCLQFEPELIAWTKTLPKDVVLRRQPAILGENWASMARVFYTLEALSAIDNLHGAVFEAVQTEGVNLDDPETFFNWAAKQGLNRNKVRDAYHSFSVNDTQYLFTFSLMLGVALGTALAVQVRGEGLTAVFAMVALLVALNMGFTGVDFRVADKLPEGPPRAGGVGHALPSPTSAIR